MQDEKNRLDIRRYVQEDATQATRDYLDGQLLVTIGDVLDHLNAQDFSVRRSRRHYEMVATFLVRNGWTPCVRSDHLFYVRSLPFAPMVLRREPYARVATLVPAEDAAE